MLLKTFSYEPVFRPAWKRRDFLRLPCQALLPFFVNFTSRLLDMFSISPNSTLKL